MMTEVTDRRDRRGARKRILDTAYDLFSQRGVHAVGVDEVIRRSGVAKATLYRHFPSKSDLVLAFMDYREQRWNQGLVEVEVRKQGKDPEEQLLVIFDVLDDWFHRDSFDACTFIKVLLEMRREHPLGQASIEHLEHIRGIVCGMAEEAGLRDPEAFARAWHILVKGAIISAAEGDVDAARRAEPLARYLIAQHR